MKLDGKCLGYVLYALELVKKLATGPNLGDSVCIDKFVLFEVTATSSNVKHTSGDGEAKFPSATLHIILELVSWDTVPEWIVDKKVIKKVLQLEGNGRPNERDVVTMEWIGKLQDSKELLKDHGEREEPCEFNIDVEQVTMEDDKVVVMTMRKGEIALVIMFSEYAMGALEAWPALIVVPPHSTFFYVVEPVFVIVVKDKKFEVANKEKEGGSSDTIYIMAGIDDGKTFDLHQSAYIGVQVHVKDQIIEMSNTCGGNVNVQEMYDVVGVIEDFHKQVAIKHCFECDAYLQPQRT
uniref:peptidyl-prolyl cis-trans isomerase FKBP65-like isoform X2 n=1 Tax=Fragaria vesca subsp. vesca TaxID=101020 RepID=UPI0005C92EEB|nr:PREDICTED: peptidyl-prolyl cis-trans isomerase FKBP65-like isoform X2 [Fragaria vesca subsp. vesca]